METPFWDLAFGPVPSRRLGRSLGINNIRPKTCTYACAYCQVGRTTRMGIRRRAFVDPLVLAAEVGMHVRRARDAGETIDYLTFVAGGEPTLEAQLGRQIDLLKPLGVPIAVITNASLISIAAVRRDLDRADWVSVKVDSVDEAAWRRINHPHPGLSLERILQGIARFACDFAGTLVTETMLVAGRNDQPAAIARTAEYLTTIAPVCAYLAVPIRPPADRAVEGPETAALNQAYQILADRLARVELLIGYEGSAFAASGDVARDLLSITAVHPMRREAVAALLLRAQAGWSLVDDLINRGLLREVTHRGERFYLRVLQPRAGEMRDIGDTRGKTKE